MTELKRGILDDDIRKILEMVRDNPVSAIMAPTGSGKSVRCPAAMAKEGARVFVVEPTVVSVETLAYYVKELNPDLKVGKAAEGNVQYTSETQVVFCTSGHMRRKLLNMFTDGSTQGRSIDFCDVLIVDEAHNGSLDADIIMALWKTAFDSGVVVPHMVMMSATLSLADTPFPEAPSFQVIVHQFPVKVEYFGRDFPADSRELYESAALAMINRHVANPVAADQTDAWLAFAAGSGEVDSMIRQLEAYKEMNADKSMEIMPIYSTLKTEDITAARETKSIPPGTRRIIIATNIVEAAITIEGLTGIFDTLTEKFGDSSQTGGFRLSLGYISKASAAQRLGRTGRTNPGFDMRMCTQEFFESLPAQRPPEIQRIPLYSMVIEVMSSGLDPEKLFRGRLHSARLNQAIKLLRQLNMLDGKRVTSIGRFAPEFPLSVRCARILYDWVVIEKRPPFPCIVAMALIDCFGPSYFWYPSKDRTQSPGDYKAEMDAYYEEHFEKYNDTTDLGILYKLWDQMFQEVLRPQESLQPHRGVLSKWCNVQSVNNKKMTEVLSIIRQIRNSLMRLGYNVALGRFMTKTVNDALTPLLREAFRDQIFKQDGSRLVNTETAIAFKLDARQALQRFKPAVTNEIVGLVTAEIQGKGAPNRFISLFHPLPPKLPGIRR